MISTATAATSIASPTVVSLMQERRFDYADAVLASPASPAAEEEEPGNTAMTVISHSPYSGNMIHSDELKEEEEEKENENEEDACIAKEGVYRTRKSHPHAQRILLEPNDPDFLHESLRFHESRAMLSRFNGFSFRITSVEKIVNAELERKFNQANAEMAKLGHHSAQPIHPVYHATPSSNLSTVVREGLRIDKRARGIFGAGYYVTPHADYAAQHCHADGKLKSGQLHELLRCDVLPGRQAVLPHSAINSKLRNQFDSHAQPNSLEVVVFNSHAILPRFIVTFRAEPSPGFKFESMYLNEKNALPSAAGGDAKMNPVAASAAVSPVAALAVVPQPRVTIDEWFTHRLPIRSWRENNLERQGMVFELNGTSWNLNIEPGGAGVQPVGGFIYLQGQPVGSKEKIHCIVKLKVVHPFKPTQSIIREWSSVMMKPPNYGIGAESLLPAALVDEYTNPADGCIEIKVMAVQTELHTENRSKEGHKESSCSIM